MENKERKNAGTAAVAQSPWDTHYLKTKSILAYPDENLVRMIKAFLIGKKPHTLASIDLGCGTGRHLKLLHESGFDNIMGLDTSLNALVMCKGLYILPLVQGNNMSLPFKDSAFDVAISWGSLHYCAKELLKQQLSEIHRIMKKGGRFFGTLRSDMDTYLKTGKNIGNDTWVTDIPDIKNSVVSFYNESELKDAMSIFRAFKYGTIERTIIGDMQKRISHWVFWADK
ncbi:MAG: class I SAM-dependent methyltransferase [Spirochaetota bacterium]